MNTPAHLLINLAVLSSRRIDSGRLHSYGLAILLGALLPDVFMFIFYGYEKFILGTHEQEIWRIKYFLPFWQNIFDLFNSIPLIAVAFLIGLYRKSLFLQALTLSMLFHCLLDFPLHNDDAHRHFFPLSDWRFISPFSYWDSSHYGQYFLFIEVFLSFIAGLYLLVTHNVRWVKAISCLLLCIYVGFGIFAYYVWGF